MYSVGGDCRDREEDGGEEGWEWSIAMWSKKISRWWRCIKDGVVEGEDGGVEGEIVTKIEKNIRIIVNVLNGIKQRILKNKEITLTHKISPQKTITPQQNISLIKNVNKHSHPTTTIRYPTTQYQNTTHAGLEYQTNQCQIISVLLNTNATSKNISFAIAGYSLLMSN